VTSKSERATLETGSVAISPDTETDFYDRVGDFWDRMLCEDRLYATSRPPQERCPWCKGITRHHPMCQEQLDGWSYPMPWGKHKGKLLRDIPTDYLCWLWKREIISDLRRELRRELDSRGMPVFDRTA